MEVLKALEELKEKIENPKQFLGMTMGLNKEECALLIRRIHNLLPDSIKEAEKVTAQAEKLIGTAQMDAEHAIEKAKSDVSRITEEAQKEANRILEQAKLERERLLSENEILKAAKSEAEQIRNATDAEATRLRRSADDYAMDVLSRLENVITKAAANIERGKAELQRTAPQTKPVPVKTK